jgi:tetratricopeptide (TPR) repeat protein
MLRRVVTLVALLALVRGFAMAAPDQWVEVRSDHFRVLTDSNEKQARHILDQFERMRWMFQTLFPKLNVDPAAPIVVVAAKNQKTFETMEPEAYLAKGQIKLGGYFMQAQDKNYILLSLDAENENHPFAAVYHEYTHLQFSPAAEWLPLWLNEGFAEFFQNTDIHNKDVQIGEPSFDDILYLQQNRLIPLPVLFSVDANSPYYHEESKGSVFYSESWALTHFLEMTDHEKNTHRLQDYLGLVSRHEDSVAAAEKAFGDLKQLQNALEFYIHAGSYKQFVLNSAAAPIDESAYKVRALSQTDSDAARADVLAYVQRFKDSRALLDQVLKADPNNAQARETMGFLAFREGHLDEAKKWYEEAVKLNPQSYLAQYYFASLSMNEGPGEQDRKEQDKEIEASLRASIQLNPRFAPSYDRLASFFGMRRENLDEARKLALQAIKLDPANLAIRMNAANVFMTSNRYDDAALLLESCLKLARNPGESAMVHSRIDQLNEFKALRARADGTAAGTSSESGSVGVVPPGGAVKPGRKTGPTVVVAVDEGPKHPTEPANGPRHQAEGVLRGVKCSYPSVIEFRVEGAKKTVSLYSNNYFKLDFTALGFTPEGEIHPCDGIEGMKARVQYAESSDKTVDGQAIAIELRK